MLLGPEFVLLKITPKKGSPASGASKKLIRTGSPGKTPPPEIKKPSEPPEVFGFCTIPPMDTRSLAELSTSLFRKLVPPEEMANEVVLPSNPPEISSNVII